MPTSTFNFQSPEFPASGTKPTRDGAPLSTRLGVDLITGCNNLNYTFPFGGQVHSFNTKFGTDPLGASYDKRAGLMTGIYNTAPFLPASGEYFMAQLPTLLPKVNGYRFCWTLGIYPFPANSDTGDVTISRVTVYIAPAPYVFQVNQDDLVSGADQWITNLPFDKTKMGQPYGVSDKSVALSIPNPTANPGYHFIDNSAGTTGLWMPGDNGGPHSDSFLSLQHIILTGSMSHTAFLGESRIGFDLGDFSWWVKPE